MTGVFTMAGKYVNFNGDFKKVLAIYTASFDRMDFKKSFSCHSIL